MSKLTDEDREKAKKEKLRKTVNKIVCRIWDDGRRDALKQGTLSDNVEYTDQILKAYKKAGLK